MGLLKYLFNPGEPGRAENLSSINPDNITAQGPAILTGGTSPSSLATFQSLGNGANNGKFKINIDGIIYDNILVDLAYTLNLTEVKYVSTNSLDNYRIIFNGQYHTQTITTGANQTRLTKFNWQSGGGAGAGTSPTLTVKVYTGGVWNAGTLVGQKTVSNIGGFQTCTFDTPLVVAPNTSYNIRVYADNGTAYTYYAYQYYAGGKFLTESGGDTSADMSFELFGNDRRAISSMDDIATEMQISLRAATSGSHSVSYSTNKFVITGVTTGRDKYILKLLTPTTGTDISGNGATKYLDLGTGATETAGTGVEYYLPRLRSDGKLPGAIMLTQHLSTLTWNNTNNSQYILVPSNIDEVILEWEFANNTASSTTIAMLVNQIVAGYSLASLVSTAITNLTSQTSISLSVGQYAASMSSGKLYIKTGLHAGKLIANGFVYPNGAGSGGSIGFSVDSATALSRIDITPPYAVTGSVRIYSRKYS